MKVIWRASLLKNCEQANQCNNSGETEEVSILLNCCPKYPSKIKTRQQVRELFLLQGNKLTLYKPPFYLFQDTDTSAGRAEGPRASSDEVHQDNEVAEEAQQLQLIPGSPVSP